MGAAGVLEAFIIDRSVLGARQPDLVLTPDGGSIEGDLSGLRTLVVDPMGIDDVLDSMLTVGDALGLHREAARVVTGLKERLFSAQEGVNAFVSAGRLAVVVGVDPLVVAGGWVAQMIERAGGEHPLNPTSAAEGIGAGMLQSSRRAGPARVVTRREWEDEKIDRVIVSPQGATLEEACAAARRAGAWTGAREMLAVEGRRSFARPGPGLAETFEWLAKWLGRGVRPDEVAGVEVIEPGG